MPEDLINKNGQASWELDRKVPLAIILTLLIQFVLGIWYASKFDSRMNFLELQMATLQTNYITLNNAREVSNLNSSQLKDGLERNNDMLRALLNRSTSLHPEFNQDQKLKDPN